MCGICGFIGRTDDELMSRMLDSLGHRGPDDRGRQSLGNVGLGMTRLAIIDLRDGHQPMQSADDPELWCVFNGEIYNYREMRDELAAAGCKFRTASDTETILAGYRRWGQEVWNRLNGMFAVALWDGRAQTLTVVRDRYGVKPLFYALVAGELIFGSEIKAVLQHESLPRERDDEALSHYLSFRHVPAPFTIYRDVRALRPGERLTWKNGAACFDRWYTLPMIPRAESRGEDELADELESLLRDSVRLRLRSDVQYGSMLSGGIDSSLVTALACKISGKPLDTFCLTFADQPRDKQDGRFSRMVAEQYATRHHEFSLSWSDLADDLPTVLNHLDQPFAGVLSSYWLSRRIRRHVKVALSGDGADDVFASYGHHRLVWPIEAIQAAQREGREPAPADFGHFGANPGLVRELAALEPWQWRLTYGAFMEREKATLLTAETRTRLSPYPTDAWLREVWQRCPPGNDALNRLLWCDIHTLLPNEVLYFNDLLSMAHGLEVRTPFLDYRLVEFACGLPGTLKIKGLVLKYLLRKVAARHLPAAIIERPKEGFVLPKHVWLREGLAPLLHKLLSPARLRAHGIFDPAATERLKTEFLAGNDRLTFRVWTIMVLQAWLDAHPGM